MNRVSVGSYASEDVMHQPYIHRKTMNFPRVQRLSGRSIVFLTLECRTGYMIKRTNYR